MRSSSTAMLRCVIRKAVLRGQAPSTLLQLHQHHRHSAAVIMASGDAAGNCHNGFSERWHSSSSRPKRRADKKNKKRDAGSAAVKKQKQQMPDAAAAYAVRRKKRTPSTTTDADRRFRPRSLPKIFKAPVLEAPPPQLAEESFRDIDRHLLARRRATANFLPNLLSRDKSWREIVVRLLSDQLPEPSRGGSKKHSWLHDAHEWYHDSLRSFREKVEADPSCIGASLDRLAEAGFDSRQHQDKYRAVSGFRYEVSKLATEIMEQEQRVKKEEANMAANQSSMSKLQKDIDGLDPGQIPAGQSPAEKIQTQPLWEQALNSVRGMFSDPTNTAPKNSNDNGDDSDKDSRNSPQVDKKMQQLRRKLSRLEKEGNSLKEKLDAAKSKLESLRKKRQSLEAPMTNEEYDRATEALDASKDEICGVMAEHIAGRHRLILERYQVLDKQTDLTRPQEWFPHARLTQRKIIFHAGPTNSGKTYNALERLKNANKGMYLGPLRLLAAEIYEKFTSEGIYCNLYTGQDKREIPFATHGAATVEMASNVDDFDVIVIDEIQMIADLERGFGWTRALLGARCPEIHVCGGAEAEPVLKKLAAACGDELEIIRYDRFSPLKVTKKSLARSTDQRDSYRNVEKGDCVVAFSRNDIFAIKREIEKLTDFKCCVVYGSLPPQTRSEQARLFNDPDSGYDILVASDAIGMGLNLNIRRIIFNSIYKNDGSGIVRLDHSAVKQISGRAGRRNSVFPDGIITCRCPEDLAYIRECMETEIKPIQRAGLLPTAGHLEIFDSTLQVYGKQGKSSMYSVLKQFGEMASIKSDYFLNRQTPMHEIAKAIDEYPLSIRDKYTMCLCPVSTNNGKSMEILKRFAAKLSAGEVSGLANRMIPRKPKTMEDLARLCGIFSDVDLFLWLQNKFPPANYIEQRTALELKESAVRMIGESLQDTAKLRLNHCYIKRDKSVRKEWERRNRGRKQHDEFCEDEGSEQEDDWNRLVPDI